MSIVLRIEEERDFRSVEQLTREAFWDVYRPGCCEHLIVHKLRKSPAFVKELSCVAVENDIIVGNVMCSRAKVVNAENKEIEVLSMGPIGVLPEYQKKGIGALLIDLTIKKAKELGFNAIIIFGNPSYYHRFGFVNAEKYGIKTSTGDNFDAFMALELYEGALKGITGKYYEDKAFEVQDEELEVFDKGFPYKEKHVTDTQLH